MAPDLEEQEIPARLASFVARQPIFDHDLEVTGYELLFRNHPEDSDAEPLPAQATPKTIVAAFTEIGIDAIVGDYTAYVNAPREFLLEDHARALPPDQVAIEVLENVAFDPDVLRKLAALWNGGYRIVFDDFAWRDEYAPVLKLAQGVKIEVDRLDQTKIETLLGRLEPYGIDVIAEKVETRDEFELCRELGFTHFQGHFLARPHTVGSAGIPADRVSKVALIALLQDESTEIDQLEQVISRDVGLSFRLLRYLNSAHFFLPRRVHSIRDAIRLLGPRPLRTWASLIVLADVSDQPLELVVTAMVRAKMCELLMKDCGSKTNQFSAFTVGLFSVVDAILSIPMTTLVGMLPFTASVQEALVGNVGELGKVLRSTIAYETGHFEEAVRTWSDSAGLTAAYVDAVAWAETSRQILSA